MLPQQAIDMAKVYVGDLFAGEGAMDIGLEELSFQDKTRTWEVTIGFSRTWDQRFSQRLAPDAKPPPRTFKTILIRDRDAAILGIKHWSEAA